MQLPALVLVCSRNQARQTLVYVVGYPHDAT